MMLYTDSNHSNRKLPCSVYPMTAPTSLSAPQDREPNLVHEAHEASSSMLVLLVTDPETFSPEAAEQHAMRFRDSGPLTAKPTGDKQRRKKKKRGGGGGRGGGRGEDTNNHPTMSATTAKRGGTGEENASIWAPTRKRNRKEGGKRWTPSFDPEQPGFHKRAPFWYLQVHESGFGS